jgi:hypothetical protein
VQHGGTKIFQEAPVTTAATGVEITLIGGPLDGHEMTVPRATPRIYVARTDRRTITSITAPPEPSPEETLLETCVYIHLFGDRYLYNAIWDRLK